MLAAERHAYILDELTHRGVIRIAKVANRLNTSVMTIRRDLDILESQGLLKKVHGGAKVREASNLAEPAFKTKSLKDQTLKEAIAETAATLVQPAASIALLGGSTVFALAQEIVNTPRITVVTNSLPVSDLFHREGRSDQTVILAGGMRTPTDSFVGDVTVSVFARLNIDLAFMGAHGMDLKGGFSSPNVLESETNRAVREHTKHLVMLADHSKWREVAFSTFAQLNDADILVTDSGLETTALDALNSVVSDVRIAKLPDAKATQN